MFSVVRIAIQPAISRLFNSEHLFFVSCGIIVIRMRFYDNGNYLAESTPGADIPSIRKGD